MSRNVQGRMMAAILFACFGIRIWLEARELQPHFFGRMKVPAGIPGHLAMAAKYDTPLPQSNHTRLG